MPLIPPNAPAAEAPEGAARGRARLATGRARLADVAAQAGVSTATVSRAFNEPDKVTPAVRDRVLEAARALAWVPNAAGRALASNRSHIGGIVIPTLDDEIFASQAAGMQAGLAAHGKTLFIGCTNYDPAEGVRQVRAMLARGVEGLAVVGEAHPPALFAELDAHALPYVVTYGWREDSVHPVIGFDNAAAFARLAQHLLDLGHRRFSAIFQPSRDNDRVQDRIAGLRATLAKAGAALLPGCFHEGGRSIADGRSGLRAVLSAPQRPTAIVCGNDHLAIGVLLEAAELGLRVPEDLSVTGFDDIALAHHIRPGLTTMKVDTYRIGQAAAAFIVARMAGERLNMRERIDPTFHIRASTAPPR